MEDRPFSCVPQEQRTEILRQGPGEGVTNMTSDSRIVEAYKLVEFWIINVTPPRLARGGGRGTRRDNILSSAPAHVSIHQSTPQQASPMALPAPYWSILSPSLVATCTNPTDLWLESSRTADETMGEMSSITESFATQQLPHTSTLIGEKDGVT